LEKLLPGKARRKGKVGKKGEAKGKEGRER